MADIILTQEDIARFWSKTSRDTASGCLEWTAARNEGGYGLFGKNRSSLLAHRIAWTILNGQIPADLDVLHRCDNPRCVEIGHLFSGDAAVNVSDMVAKGRHRSQRATHCRKGHEYAGDNLYARRDGTRDCRACQKERNAAWKKSHDPAMAPRVSLHLGSPLD